MTMTMNINLSPQLETMVRQKVTSSFYTSASEVVRGALPEIEIQDQMQAIKLKQLQQDISEGLDDEPTLWSAEEIKRAGRQLNEQKNQKLRALWQEGINSGSAGALNMAEIKKEAHRRYEEEHKKP